MQMKGSDDVIDRSIKTINTELRISPEILEQ